MCFLFNQFVAFNSLSIEIRIASLLDRKCELDLINQTKSRNALSLLTFRSSENKSFDILVNTQKFLLPQSSWK